MVFFVKAIEVHLYFGIERSDHRIDARINCRHIRGRSTDRTLFIADEDEFLKLDEMVDGAPHGLRLFFTLCLIHCHAFFTNLVI